jgi:FkbM family methyltransferase
MRPSYGTILQELHVNMIKSIQLHALHYLSTLPIAAFARWFNYINVITTRYPITTRTITSSEYQISLLSISDSAGQKITISQPSRVRLYRHGIAPRLQTLLDEYLISDLTFRAGDLVVDCGANIGEVSMALQQKSAIYSICIEPETKDAQALRMNLDPQRTSVFEVLLWHENRLIDFYQKNLTGDSSVFQVGTDTTVIQKRAMTLSSILATHPEFQKRGRVKLLKLEAEGAEPEVLQGALPILNNIEYIAVDCGPERITNGHKETTVIPVMQLLTNHGFIPIKFNRKRIVFLFKNTNLTT